MHPLIRVTTIEDGVTTVRTNEPDPAVVSLAALMECSKRELAVRVTELTAELDRERAQREHDLHAARIADLKAVRGMVYSRMPNMEVIRQEHPTGGPSYILVQVAAPSREKPGPAGSLPAVGSFG